MNKLPLHNMASRHVGLTTPIADSYTQAAEVCLNRHHTSPIEFIIKGRDNSLTAIIEWKKPDERTKAAWANEIDTTEAGAYACALAAVELTNGFFAVRRAETKTGVDYYIAPSGYDFEDLENCLRFEVSGVDKGTSTTVEQRLKMKLDQAATGLSNLPAMACVVGFQARLIRLNLVKEK